jgi:hypothetical protein
LEWLTWIFAYFSAFPPQMSFDWEFLQWLGLTLLFIERTVLFYTFLIEPKKKEAPETGKADGDDGGDGDDDSDKDTDDERKQSLFTLQKKRQGRCRVQYNKLVGKVHLKFKGLKDRIFPKVGCIARQTGYSPR